MEEAQRFADEAQDFAEDRKLEFAYPFIALHQGNISSAQGRLETASEHFTRAEQLALDNDLRPILWQSRAGAGHIHAIMGNEALASRKFQAAQTTINEIANLFEDDRLRQSFLDHAQQGLE